MLPPSVANEGTEAGFLEPSVPPEVLRAVLPVLRPSPRPCRHGRPVSPAGRPCFIPAPALALQPPAGLSPSPGAQEGRHEGGRLPQGRGCGGVWGHPVTPGPVSVQPGVGAARRSRRARAVSRAWSPASRASPPPAAPQLWSRRLLVGLRTSHTLRLRLQCTSDALRCSRRRAGPAQGRRRGGRGKQRSVAQILLGLKPGGGPS